MEETTKVKVVTSLMPAEAEAEELLTLVARVRHTPVAEADLDLVEVEFRHRPAEQPLSRQVAHANRPSIAHRHSVNRTLANNPESQLLRQSRSIPQQLRGSVRIQASTRPA